MNTKCLALIIFVIVWIPLNVAAAQDSADADSSANLASPWAVQFRVTENFTLSAFQGSVISAQYSLQEREAIRFGLSVGGSSGSSEGVNADEGDNIAPRISGSSRSGSSVTLGLDVQYLFMSGPAKRTRFFAGGGPAFGFSSGDSELDNTSNFSTISARSRQETETNSWDAGVVGVLGVEWFANRRISFLAEYFLDFSYQKSKRNQLRIITHIDDLMTVEDVSREESTSSGWSFGGRFVRFGLSVYL